MNLSNIFLALFLITFAISVFVSHAGYVAAVLALVAAILLLAGK